MQLTTPQIYALFAITVAVVVLIGISYIAGLRTGRKAGEETGYENGRSTAATYWKKIITGIRENFDTRQQAMLEHQYALRTELEETSALLGKAKQQLQQDASALEQLDNVIGRLQAKALTPEDVLNIKLAARQLAIAAKHIARSGTNKPNQAALAETALKEIASRFIEAAPNPSPKQTIERDEDGYALPPRIDYIGDGKSTWERIDDEHRAQGLPAPQCM